jgi:hypothetical protein
MLVYSIKKNRLFVGKSTKLLFNNISLEQNALAVSVE